ncbi:DUF1926 domain-containing protein [Thiospirochaeta perfilievii]|uniref:DUF1926 domain-containing protein n=1 Tax=Thiospirochaeta perfilievii TaxID=252967 RepID=A0A5C1Q9L7_9SPIO|nr:alpha-amylase/4-alpha-glucanotransferase domain-containing protein [Thiospirochaeta perfilievii]QEN03800.1 DUF1926 domain-containing protein [Thiospirochaeta perfilievii]
MGKVKLILGIYNSQPPEEENSVVEEFYQRAYKTFLTTLYNSPSIKLSLYYNGALLEWIENSHPEFLSVVQEMVNSKQVEMLSGGYYDPAQTLLPITDRVGQMEKLTTYIRKNFSKKPRGCFLAENVWDSSLVSSLKTCGFEYIFLDDNQFKASGILDEKLCRPVITEDQGKIITVIPINSKLTNMYLRSNPQELIDYLQENSHLDGVFTILFKGEYLNSLELDSKGIKSWLEEFNSLLEENSSWIDTINTGKYVKQIQGSLDRVYFPQYSINGMRNKPLPLISQKELNRLTRHLGALGDVSHWINSGFFKQFIARYYDSSLIYSKMTYISLLVNQIKGDRSRKKTAREELWRTQSHYVYWHGSHLGIYDKKLRSRTYKFLLEAELSTREKGIFKAGISHIDINLDGKKEALYQGDNYNSYISANGGIIFELDFFKSNLNLLSTVQRVEESYHTDDNNPYGYDSYPRKMFHDHFLESSITPENFLKNEYNELGNFIDGVYDYDSLNRESKYIVLLAKGLVNCSGSKHNVSIQKKYLFNKKGLVLTYNIENHDELPLETTFSPEFNLSLSGIEKKEIPSLSSDKEYFLLDKITKTKNINNLIIEDKSDNVTVNLSFSNETSKFWSIPQYSKSMKDGELLDLYQFTTFLPQWDIKIGPNKVWTLAINLSLS